MLVYITLVLSGVLVVRSGLTDTCPATYTIPNDPSRIVIVTRNKKDCHRLLQDRTRSAFENHDLDPKVGVPYLRDGEYFLNFTWTAKKDSRNRFPKKHVVRFVYSDPERNVSSQEECIVLKPVSRIAKPLQDSIDLSLACITLRNYTTAAFVSIQVWQVSGTCNNRKSKWVPATCSGIERSSKRHYALSLDYYKHQICSCHYTRNVSRPQMDVEVSGKTDDIYFRITLTNLPNFLKFYTITVWTNEAESLKYTFDASMMMIQNGRLVLTTDSLPRTIGTYSLLFYYECVQSRSHDIMLPSDCHTSDKYNFTITEVKAISQTKSGTFGTICIVSGVLVFTLVTVALVYTYQKLSYKMGEAATKVYRAANSKRVTRKGIQLKKAFLRQETEEKDTDVLLPNHWQQSVILLSHPTDMEPVYRNIKDKLGTVHIKLEDGGNGSWRDFASGRFTSTFVTETCDTIVILMSTGLLELLCGAEEVRDRRLEERFHENVPDVIMQGLYLLGIPTRQKVVLHIVSTKCDKGRELTEQFIEAHEYIKCMKIYKYYFHNETLDLSENKQEFERFKINLQNRGQVNLTTSTFMQ